MICVAIYAVLVNSMTIAADIHAALFSIAAYTVILCFSLLKPAAWQNPCLVRVKGGDFLAYVSVPKI